jgi:hypothetical protein
MATNYILAQTATRIDQILNDYNLKWTGNYFVYTTGNQTISGIKNFISPPTVNGTGILLTSETGNFISSSQTGNFINTSQTGNFYASSNPSGFITGISNLVFTTGNQTIAGNKTFSNDMVINARVTAPNQTVGSSATNNDLVRLIDDEESLLWTPQIRQNPLPTAATQLISGATFSNLSNYVQTALTTSPTSSIRTVLFPGFTNSAFAGGGTNFSVPWKVKFSFLSILAQAASITGVNTRTSLRYLVGYSSSVGFLPGGEDPIPAGASAIGIEHRVKPDTLGQHQIRLVARDGTSTSLGNVTTTLSSLTIPVAGLGSVASSAISGDISSGLFPMVYFNNSTSFPHFAYPNGTQITGFLGGSTNVTGLIATTGASLAGSHGARLVRTSSSGALVSSNWIDYFADSAGNLGRSYDVVVENLGNGTSNMYVQACDIGTTTRFSRHNRATPTATITGSPTGSRVFGNNTNNIEAHCTANFINAPTTTTQNSVYTYPIVTWI